MENRQGKSPCNAHTDDPDAAERNRTFAAEKRRSGTQIISVRKECEPCRKYIVVSTGRIFQVKKQR